jgi:predicted ATPase
MLDSLRIKNFRSLQDFEIPKLGRVNLLVGKNNSGKSTVLEALRLYAGNAQRPLLDAIAQEHDERARISEASALEADLSALPYQDFFTGRCFPSDDTAIEIGSATSNNDQLRISRVWMEESAGEAEQVNGELIRRTQRRFLPTQQADDALGFLEPVILVRKGARSLPPIRLNRNYGNVGMRRPIEFALPCSLIPTQFISMDELADEWDKIVFTEPEEVVRKALRVIEPTFDNLTFVRADAGSRTRASRTVMVKLRDMGHPVPLNSMGDGMLRVLQLALKLFSAKGGFLLIDEFENGLHYSVQKSIWALLFEMAEQYDIQIFATTHSWDCIESFTQVALEHTQAEGCLLRLGRSQRTSDKGRIIATIFDEAALAHITQTDMEVR